MRRSTEAIDNERLRAERDHFQGAFNNTVETLQRTIAERDSLRLDAERLRAALLMMKHAFESDNRPNMLIVNAALSAAHGAGVKP